MKTAQRLYSTLARPHNPPRASPSRPQRSVRSPLHLGSDLRLGGTALYRDWKSGGRLPRRSQQTRRAPELFFKSDEAHIRSLAWDTKGNLIAGSDGSGLVYRIDPQGNGYVLFEAPRREITAIAIGKRDHLCGMRGRQEPQSAAAAARAGTASITITVVQPESLQAANASTSVPEGTEVYALAEGQAPRALWSSKDDIVYAMTSSQDGLMAISGNRGHIFRFATMAAMPTSAICRRNKA